MCVDNILTKTIIFYYTPKVTSYSSRQTCKLSGYGMYLFRKVFEMSSRNFGFTDDPKVFDVDVFDEVKKDTTLHLRRILL